MRPEKLYLIDIVGATEAIERFCATITEAQFLQDELRQSAVLQKLIVIGEAAARLSPEFRNAHPEIEWPDIVGFRNIAIHEYFAIAWEIVWATSISDVPMLKSMVSRILETEFTG